MNSELIEQFLDHYWLTTGASQNTLSAYRSDLIIFSNWLNKSLIIADEKSIKNFNTKIKEKFKILSDPKIAI